MHGQGFFYQALIYLTAAVVSVPVARRLGLGSVLGYLLAGVAIGPFALGLVGEEGQDVLHFAEFGVVLMLFLIGLELEPSRVWRLRAPILGVGGSQVAVTTAVLAAIVLGFGLGWRKAVAIGMILALSSTAIVLQTLNEKRLLNTSGGQSSFAVLLFQDIAVIPILALLPLFAAAGATLHEGEDHGETWVAGLPAWMETLVVIGAVAVIVILSSLIGRKVGIHPKQRDDWLVVPNLWGVIVGRPSLMKSPALAEALKVLNKLIVPTYWKFSNIKLSGK